MWHSAFFVLVLVALILTIVNGATGKVPLWVAVLILCMAMLVPFR